MIVDDSQFDLGFALSWYGQRLNISRDRRFLRRLFVSAASLSAIDNAFTHLFSGHPPARQS
jgi:hypothetical protein